MLNFKGSDDLILTKPQHINLPNSIQSGIVVSEVESVYELATHGLWKMLKDA